MPTSKIESGVKTDELIRTRGWTYWHHIFNARQILIDVLLEEQILKEAQTQVESVVGILGLHKCIDWNTKLCRWNSGKGNEKSEQTFYNQAFNTMLNWGTRSIYGLKTSWFYDIHYNSMSSNCDVKLCDATDVDTTVDLWITDPPYADAVMYPKIPS